MISPTASRSQCFRLAAYQAVTEADQIIAHVDGGRRAVLAVQSWGAVAVLIVVFDIVVYQRRFVKRFDRQGTALDGVGQLAQIRRCVGLSATAAGQRIVHGQGDERPRMLAAAGQEVVSDGLGNRHRIQPVDSIAIALGQRWASVLPRRQSLQLVRLKHRPGGLQQRIVTGTEFGKLAGPSLALRHGLGIRIGPERFRGCCRQWCASGRIDIQISWRAQRHIPASAYRCGLRTA